jgi:hypothetical protein
MSGNLAFAFQYFRRSGQLPDPRFDATLRSRPKPPLPAPYRCGRSADWIKLKKPSRAGRKAGG